MADEQYSAVVVGTGFASSFFLLEYLKRAGSDVRVLVLERGKKIDPVRRLEQRSSSDISFNDVIVNRTPQKSWVQNIAFGGGTCWTGNTPRFHPNDFRTKSLYGIGQDWPLSYDELEPHYTLVEGVMAIAGASEGPYPRSAPYPGPPHLFNALDEALAARYPGLHVHMPSARASSPKAGRPVCCVNGVCSYCPVNAKFQIDLHMATLYDDPRVTLRLESPVERLDIQGGQVRGAYYRQGKSERYAKADLGVVGAHAIMTPFILKKSGLDDHALGRYLNEQISVDVQVDLDGIDNFGGGQAVTGLSLMFMDGPFRREHAGCLIENWNVPWLRAERDRWRQRGMLKFVFEDLPDQENRVGVAKEDPSKPEIYYSRHSDYLKAGMARIPAMMEELGRKLPIESYQIRTLENLGGSAHIQGTTRMGNDPSDSVVDRTLRHHKVRNLLVLGAGAFPTCPAANPTLTLSALSSWAAERLLS